ncbi:hypothetical protein J6I39_01960 [bacterium]|nr:hypothetical protein [bacterium]
MAKLKEKILQSLKGTKQVKTTLNTIAKSQENLLKNYSNPVFNQKDRGKLLKSYTDLQNIGKSLYRYGSLMDNNYLADAQEEKEDIKNVVLKGGISYCHYVWHSENGEHTCDECRELDGQVFEYYDEVPERPHPNCRCTVEIVEGEIETDGEEPQDDKDKIPPRVPTPQTPTPKPKETQNSVLIVINNVYDYIQTNNGQIPNAQITANISWEEMIGHDNTPAERKSECTKEVLTNIYHTAQQLQKIHDTYWQGRPLIISSGWRSVRNNKSCGGAPRSRHLYGKAVDFNLGLPTIKKDFDTMQKYWKGYVLFEGTWIHAQMD